MSGKEVQSISYPHGSVNARVIKEVKRSGYKYGACSWMGLNKEPYKKYMLKRIPILSFDKQKAFIQKVNGHWDWYGWIKDR